MASDVSSYSLPPHLAEVARRELKETPAARTECLIQLRRRLSTKKPSCSHVDEGSAVDASDIESKGDSSLPDDQFLLRFLRSKKFDVRRSYAVYENYLNFFRDHPDIATGLDPASVRHVWDAGLVGGLKERDARGRSVLVTFPGRWDPTLHCLEDVLRALILQLEYMIASEETQVRGFVLVADFTNFSLYQMRSLKTWYFQTMSTLMQNAFPARFKGVYIINHPWFMSIPLSIIRPFLSEKIKNRVNLLGRDLTALKSHFHPSILPAEFGGPREPYSSREWSELMIQVHSQEKLLQYIHQIYPQKMAAEIEH